MHSSIFSGAIPESFASVLRREKLSPFGNSPRKLTRTPLWLAMYSPIAS